MALDNLFNVRQAAFILKVHHLTIRRYIKEGKLKAVRIAGNVRIKESDLQAFNKEFTPNQEKTTTVQQKLHVAKIFTEDDPFFRLKGRGASFKLSS